jgi:hypothetical protein
MQMLRVFAALLAALILNACGRADEDVSEPAPVEQTAFGEMVGTVDKARAVEGTVLRQKEDMDRTLQESDAQ